MYNHFTLENITELQPHEVFVFGSNLNGNHAGGAAKFAVEKFGAIQGQAEGIQGQSYAIPTLSQKMQKLSLSTLEKSIARFSDYAASNPSQAFYVTKIGCGIAGFDVEQIAPLFIQMPENVILPAEFSIKPVKGWKGFDKALRCRGFQYKVGDIYQEDSAKLCESGFHFCENPHDIFNYYAAGDGNRFCEVEGDAVSDERRDDSKRASKKLTIKSEISVFGICKIAVSTFFENFKFQSKIASADTNNAGYRGAANAGYCGAASVGKNGVAIVSTDGRVKGEQGAILVLVNRNYDGDILEYSVAQVDSEKIKEDVWYSLLNGQFVEVKD